MANAFTLITTRNLLVYNSVINSPVVIIVCTCCHDAMLGDCASCAHALTPVGRVLCPPCGAQLP